MTKIATTLNSKKTISATLTFAVALLLSIATLFTTAPANAATLNTQAQVEMTTTAATTNAKSPNLGTGQASFYGPGFAGRPTANGETFNPSAMTAAHRTLPFGTKVKVTNLNNGKSVVVRINDRGPFHGNRIIDLSKGAASKIGMVASGVAKVKLERIA